MKNQELVLYFSDGSRKIYRPAAAFQMDYNLKVAAVTYIDLITGKYMVERIDLERVAHIKLS